MPSVLDQPSYCPVIPASIHSHLSINTPRRVLSVFTDANDEPLETDASGVSAHKDAPNPSVPSPGRLSAHQASVTKCAGDNVATSRIQWNDRGNRVQVFVPTPRTSEGSLVSCDASRQLLTTRACSSPRAHPIDDNDSFTWALVEATAKLSAEHAQTTATGAMEDSSMDHCLSRRASNLHLRAGTFDELVGEGPTKAEEAAGFLMGHDTGRLEHLLSGAGTYMHEDSGSDSGYISRRTSNMHQRAGTFEEILACGSFHGTSPAAVIPALGRTMPPPLPRVVLGASSDEDPVPSRCASNMHERAGTFNELVHETDVDNCSTYRSTCALPPCVCPDMLVDTDMVSDVDTNELMGGAISRRATNMAGASGPFDMLVDEDGDELPDEEHSSDDVSIHCTGHDADQAHGGVISLNGMLSEADIHGDSASPQPTCMGKEADDENTFFQLSPTKTALPDLAQRGRRSVLHISARSRRSEAEISTPGQLIDVHNSQDSWQAIGGRLLSDAVAFADEAGSNNPVGEERAPSAATSIDTFDRCDAHANSQQLVWIPTKAVI
jgi:hypothetical protein